MLAPDNRTGDSVARDWPRLIQSLFADELSGVPELAVIDPLGMEALLEGVAEAVPASRTPNLLNRLPQANVSLVVDGSIVKAAGFYELRLNVVDSVSGESRFPTHAMFAGEDMLGAAVSELAANVLGFLQGQRLAADKALRPAFAFGRHNIRAVNAYLAAAQYTYRNEHAKAVEPLQRALEIDPTFVAPRVWLVSRHLYTNQRAEAEQHYEYLPTLTEVTPLERALIAYAGALIAHDANAVATNLELALEYAPGNNILLVNLALVRALRGDCAGALDALRPAIAMRWRYPPAYALWGGCSMAEGRLDDARRVLVDAATMPYVYPSVYGFLEGFAIADGDEETSRRYRARFERGFAQLDEQDKHDLVVGYDRLGSMSYRSGRSDRARRLFQRAIDIDRQSPHALLMLGTIADAAGDVPAALRFYREYLAVASGPDADRISGRLRALDPSGADTPRERRQP
jgi:tetratricopeptide (TPR) repeat protein